MNLEEALERFGLKISETDKEQDLERYNEEHQLRQIEQEMESMERNDPDSQDR